VHDITQAINIFSWFLNLELNLLDVISEILKHGLCSLVEILGIGFFPLFNPLLKTDLCVFSLQTQGSNLMYTFNHSYFFLIVGVLNELVLKIFKLWIGLVESTEIFIDLSLPKPVELIEVTKEFLHIVLCTLDRTCKKQNYLNDFFILGNPVVEWFSLVLWLILLVPVLNILG